MLKLKNIKNEFRFHVLTILLKMLKKHEDMSLIQREKKHLVSEGQLETKKCSINIKSSFTRICCLLWAVFVIALYIVNMVHYVKKYQSILITALTFNIVIMYVIFIAIPIIYIYDRHNNMNYRKTFYVYTGALAYYTYIMLSYFIFYQVGKGEKWIYPTMLMTVPGILLLISIFVVVYKLLFILKKWIYISKMGNYIDKSPINRISDDSMGIIFSFLELKERPKLSCTCKWLNSVSKKKGSWSKRLYINTDKKLCKWLVEHKAPVKHLRISNITKTSNAR